MKVIRWSPALLGLAFLIPGSGGQSASRMNSPVLSHKPLPPIAALLTSVDRHQHELEKLVEDYACTEIQQQQFLDSKGRVKKQTTSTFHVFYLDGEEVDTLIAKNGKPLSSPEQKKENQRVTKLVEKLQRREGKPRKPGATIGISTFLRVSLFSNAHWGVFHGQPVVIFDFKPNPSYKPRNLMERAAHDLVGVAWVDPQRREVVRLQAWLGNSLKLAGGLLATLQKGSEVAFEQAPVAPQLWMPTYADLNLSARVFLVKGMKQRLILHYSDYKRFNVTTAEKTRNAATQ